jgi:uncharacterized protein
VNLLLDHSWAWVASLALALLGTGLVAGVLAGLLGVGGGIVIVPVLSQLLALLGVDESVRMHVTVGTSLATIIPTAFMSARAHRLKGNLRPEILRGLLPAVLVGVLLGAVLSAVVSGRGLAGVFGVVGLIVAAHMAFSPKGASLRDGLPGRAGTSVIGLGVGTLSTLMGIGGGTLSVPILNLCRVPMHQAVATGAALGMVISIPGALGAVINGWGAAHLPPLSLGYVNLLGVALIVPATMLSVGWGARWAHATDAHRLRQWFALFLAVSAVRMLA